MSKKKLDILTESDSDENQDSIQINESYAKSYDRFRNKELLQKFKDRYGDQESEEEDEDEDEDEEDDDEDEEVELSPQFEKDFFKTLSMLKEKDARIYDSKTDFFKEPSIIEKKRKTGVEKRTPKMFLSDLERKVMLEKDGKFDEMDADRHSFKTYDEELNEIKESFKDSNIDNDEDTLLTKKVKTEIENRKEDEDYKAWLLGQRKTIQDKDNERALKGLKEFWSKPDLDKNEAFLRDYILNRRYKEDGNDDGDDKEISKFIHDSDDNLSEDENNVAKMEEFEHKYNFRFEEPDHDFIKRYPRTMNDTMRKKNETRKRNREQVKARKEQEKIRKREELKQFKALKRKEILDKIDKIKRVAGTESVELNENDLKDDFDPETHDKRMKEIFENYDVNDEEKPVFPDDSDVEEELEIENWDEWTHEEKEEDDDDDDVVGEKEDDVEERQDLKEEIMDSLIRSKKSKRKSEFAKVIESRKPLYDPETQKTFDEYLDEYYKLDYEDLIGDLPCRFKYRNVPRNDFGLNVEEVLNAPDRELNAWSSLRKTCQFRSDQEETLDVHLYKGKGRNMELKRKILPSLFASDPEEHLSEEKTKRARKSKKSRKRKREETEEVETNNNNNKNNNNKKKKKKKMNPNAEIAMSDTRLKAYDLAPGQFKRKIKNEKFRERQELTTKKKRKRKKKGNQNV